VAELDDQHVRAAAHTAHAASADGTTGVLGAVVTEGAELFATSAYLVGTLVQHIANTEGRSLEDTLDILRAAVRN
jgi:hypothetical protein